MRMHLLKLCSIIVDNCNRKIYESSVNYIKKYKAKPNFDHFSVSFTNYLLNCYTVFHHYRVNLVSKYVLNQNCHSGKKRRRNIFT